MVELRGDKVILRDKRPEDAESDYQPEDAGGFIRLNAIRLRERHRKQGYKG